MLKTRMPYTREGHITKTRPMHKYTQQTSRDPRSADDAHLMREAAEVETRLVKEQAPAERVIDDLRTGRARELTLTPEQARAESVAELARRLKASRKNTVGQALAGRSEAVQEALAALKKRRGAEKPEQEPTSKATENLRKLRSHKEAAERDDKNRRDLDQGPTRGDERGPRYSR